MTRVRRVHLDRWIVERAHDDPDQDVLVERAVIVHAGTQLETWHCYGCGTERCDDVEAVRESLVRGGV